MAFDHESMDLANIPTRHLKRRNLKHDMQNNETVKPNKYNVEYMYYCDTLAI